LDEASLLPVVGVVSQEFLIGEEFIFEATDRVEAVDRRNDLSSFHTAGLKMGLEVFDKGTINFCVHSRHYIFYLDTYVADAEHDISSKTFNTEETALFKDVI
jgi:hypothetical protein